MGTFSQIFQVWMGTAVWMAGLGVAFAVLERITPCNPGMVWWKDRRSLATDLVYWYVVPLFLRIFRQLMMVAGAALIINVHNENELREYFMHGYGPLNGLSLPLQCILIMLSQDVIMYWIHRSFHTRFGWPTHAVHHSSVNLNWMSTQRFHPVNSLLQFSLVDTLALMAGFSPAALIALGPFNIAFSALVHANLSWTFGPFKYVLASPVFHRWHHTSPKEGGMKNFAPTFPFLDVIFGTFYMPKGKLPQSYGVNIPDFPAHFMGQFTYPLRDKNYY